MTASSTVFSATLTQGPIAKTLLKLAGPMVWGMLAIISLNLVDTYFIAHLGKEPLAAMSFSLPVILMLMSLALGQCVGTGSVISRAIGGGSSLIKVLATHSLALILIIMLFFSMLGIALMSPFFALFNVPSSVLPYMDDYMKIWYLGLPFMGLAMVGNTIMTSTGNVRFPTFIMIMVALVNFILDPVLIFGLFGFPRMEMKGAALATIIAYVIAFLLSFWGIAIHTKMLSFQTTIKEMLNSWREILQISLPACASQMIVPITSAMTVWMLSSFGADVVAGYGIVSRLEAFALIFVIGLSSGLAPFVGQNWGAHLYSRARESLSIAYKIALGWGFFVAFILAIGYRFVPGLFIGDPQVISTVSLYLLTVPLSYGAVGCLFVTNAFLNAIGLSGTVAVITIIRYFVLYLPLSFLAMHFLGPQGIFLAISATNILTGIGAYIWIALLPHSSFEKGLNHELSFE